MANFFKSKLQGSAYVRLTGEREPIGTSRRQYYFNSSSFSFSYFTIIPWLISLGCS